MKRPKIVLYALVNHANVLVYGSVSTRRAYVVRLGRSYRTRGDRIVKLIEAPKPRRTK